MFPLPKFPFLFGGTFIEGGVTESSGGLAIGDFPSFSEGLSLRAPDDAVGDSAPAISLPFRRDFH